MPTRLYLNDLRRDAYQMCGLVQLLPDHQKFPPETKHLAKTHFAILKMRLQFVETTDLNSDDRI